MAAHFLFVFIMFVVCLICKGVGVFSGSVHHSTPNDSGFVYQDETVLNSWNILRQKSSSADNDDSSNTLKRTSFPPDFMFGAASSAYQYEGAAFEGGKGPSIWDTFTHMPGKISNGSNGDVAIDFYHLYKDDVKLMKNTGVDAFRISISWPRILPRGKLSEGVNKEGIAFYNNVFNELLANGITPFVALFHWDTPQALEDEYGGFLSRLVIDDFRDFAEVCFKEFGDRIKHWITMNEAYMFVSGGYDGFMFGNYAPGRCSSWLNCPQGDSAIEPYITAHHLLLSHATVVRLYRDKFQASQKGEIGMIIVSHWFLPYSGSEVDTNATQRALDFMYGWFMNPIVYGEYPSTMRSLVGNRLPEFSEEEMSMLQGSFDFIGLNYYTAYYAAHVSSSRNANITSSTDNLVQLYTTDIQDVPIGDPTAVGFLYVYPQGLHDLLLYTKQKYKIGCTIYVTETGIGELYNSSTEDQQRIDFYSRHLSAVYQAIQEGVNVKGIFGWSFLDNFEWISGYTIRFGLYYVDYDNGLQRIAKRSATWFMNFLNSNSNSNSTGTSIHH